MNTPSRAQPSARYLDLLRMYRELHEEGERFLGISAKQTFQGVSLGPHVWRIKKLIERTGAQNVLDYGCGKAMLYGLRDISLPSGGKVESIQDFWGVDYIHFYDPAYKPYTKLPTGQFEGVVCTDVMEHCPEEDLPWIIEEIFGYAEKFVFLTIASYPATKRLPNGDNAHITVRPAAWWDRLIRDIAARHPHVVWEAQVESFIPGGDGSPVRVEERLGSTDAAV